MIRILLVFPLLAAFICLMLLSKKHPAGLEDAIGRYGFKIPFLAPAGLYLAHRFPVSLGFAYDRRVINKIAELYGEKDAASFVKIHKAQQYSLSLALIFVWGLMGILGKVSMAFFIYALFLPVLVFYLNDREIDKKIVLKRRKILIDLPSFLSTLSLLLGAGLTYSASVQKIVTEDREKRPLYSELQTALSEIQSGKAAAQAYEGFARRCKVPEVTRFVSTVLQNLNRGSSDLAYVLSLLSQECWQKRKDIARKQGEEASSKLVFPMVMIFVAVSIIVLAPAIMAINK